MSHLLKLNGVAPEIDSTCFIADNVTITGDVVIGERSSVWYQSVIRGDVNKIRIGNEVNIQDLCMIHGSIGKGDTIIEDRVSIGHRAIIHGCHIKSNVLVGMGAIILDDTLIEENVVIGAGALVTQGKVLESGYLYAGVPAKKMKALSALELQIYIQGTVEAYLANAKLYQESLSKS